MNEGKREVKSFLLLNPCILHGPGWPYNTTFSHRVYRLCVVCRVRRARRSGPLQARRIGVALVQSVISL